MKKDRCEIVNSERTFMSGVLVLTVSTVIVKIIGLAYKIPLISILDADGMGYFNTAYEIFALLLPPPGFILLLGMWRKFGAAQVITSTFHHSLSGKSSGKSISLLNTVTSGVKIQSSLYSGLSASRCGI